MRSASWYGIDDLAIVLAKPVVAFGAPPSTKSYFALSGSGSASLIGVDGVEIGGRVQISINKGSDKANPAALTPSIDFLASATSNPDAWGSAAGLKAPTGPAADQFVIVNFAESNLLRVAGYITISIADFLHLSGQFSFSQSGTPQTVKIAGSTSTKQVNVMTIGASDVNAFVGVGGPYFVDSNDDGIIDEDDTPLDDGAMGFVLRNLDFALALFKPVDTASRQEQLLLDQAPAAVPRWSVSTASRSVPTCLASKSTAARRIPSQRYQRVPWSRVRWISPTAPAFAANGGLIVDTGSDPDGAGDLPGAFDQAGLQRRRAPGLRQCHDHHRQLRVRQRQLRVRQERCPADGNAQQQHHQNGQRPDRRREQRLCLRRHG
jgi:hypothetical protein